MSGRFRLTVRTLPEPHDEAPSAPAGFRDASARARWRANRRRPSYLWALGLVIVGLGLLLLLTNAVRPSPAPSPQIPTGGALAARPPAASPAAELPAPAATPAAFGALQARPQQIAAWLTASSQAADPGVSLQVDGVVPAVQPAGASETARACAYVESSDPRSARRQWVMVISYRYSGAWTVSGEGAVQYPTLGECVQVIGAAMPAIDPPSEAVQLGLIRSAAAGAAASPASPGIVTVDGMQLSRQLGDRAALCGAVGVTNGSSATSTVWQLGLVYNGTQWTYRRSLQGLWPSLAACAADPQLATSAL